MTFLTYASWALGPMLEVTLLVLIFRNKFHRPFPRFTSYILFQVVKSAILALVYHYLPAEYFDAYWTGNAISVFLAVLVMDEIWRHLFAPFRAIQQVGTAIFRWACVVLFVIAAVMAISNEASSADRVIAAVFNFDRTMRLMQFGLAVLLVFFSRVLKSSIRQQVFGIALGFGLFAALELVLVTIISSYGAAHIAAISLIKSLAYNSITLLWIGYAWRGLPAPHPVSATHEVADWNLAVIGLPEPVPEYPFISLVEDAVDRVMERSAWPKKGTTDTLRIIGGTGNSDRKT
jgi:hypothetical protein